MKAQSLKPKLVVLDNSVAVRSLEIAPGEEVRIGRHASCQIVVSHPSVSRQHARIFCDATGVHAEDLKTANGTYVNDSKIQGIVTLKSGDLIRVGQSTNPTPALVRVEDPSVALLDALTGDDKPAPPPPPPPPSGQVAQALPATAAPPPPPPPSSGTSRTFLQHMGQPMVWIPLAGVVLVAIAIGVWFAMVRGPAVTPWLSVRVEPPKVRAGWSMAIRGPEVVPSNLIKVYFGPKLLKLDAASPGEITFTVPDLGGGELGVRAVNLRVEWKSMVLFQQPIQYEVVPQIRDVEPKEGGVGAVVTIYGSGLPADVKSIQIRMGDLDAPVVDSNPGQIRFRIPVLTRDAAVQVPLEIHIGDWSAPPMPFQVGPRNAPCFPMTFSAVYVADRVWEIRHPLGPAIYIDGPPDVPGQPLPRNVQLVVDSFGSAFSRAASDPTVRFQVQDAGGFPGLFSAGAGGTRIVAPWGPAGLAFAKAKTGYGGDAVMFPFWHVVVMNEVLNLFGKGQPPTAIPKDSPLGAVLQKLHDRDIEVGGKGCPGEDDVAELSAADRDQFQQGFWAIPQGFGSIDGIWEGDLENLFSSDTDGVRHILRLALRQSGTAVTGSATIEVQRGASIRWSPGASAGVSGRLALGSGIRVDISMQPVRPFNLNHLWGTIQGGTLAGTFGLADGRRGSCRLVRRGAG